MIVRAINSNYSSNWPPGAAHRLDGAIASWKPSCTSQGTRSGVVSGIISCELIGAKSEERMAEEE